MRDEDIHWALALIEDANKFFGGHTPQLNSLYEELQVELTKNGE